MKEEIPFEAAQRQFAIDQHIILTSTDLSGTIVSVNSRFCSISGYSQEELIGQNHRILNSGYHPKEFYADLYSTLKKGNTWHGEFRNRAKDGGIFWVSTTIVPLKNTEGEIIQYYVIRTDITKCKQMKEYLQVSESMYRGLLANLDVGVVVHASDTSILMNNPKASELLGLSDDQLRGKQVIDPLWKFLREDNTPLPIEEFPVNQILASKKPIKNQILKIHRPTLNSKVAWALVNGFPVLEDNGDISVIVISFISITDIKRAELLLQLQNQEIKAQNEELTQMNDELQRAKQKIEESEEKFRILFDSAGDSIFIHDTNTKILTANQTACKEYGYTMDELISMTIKEIDTPEQGLYANERINQIMQKGYFSFEAIHKRKDGSHLNVDVNAKKIAFLGQLVVMSICRDITERKQAEQKLKKNMQELENLNNTKDKFFRIIAHDLRSPFVGIMGLSEMMESSLSMEKKDFDELLKFTKMIQLSSKSSLDLLENLMQWAKSQTGEITVDLQNISLKFLLSYTISLIQGNALKKNISIEVDLADNEVIYADQSLAETILRNLLTNAIKFTHSNGKIKVSTQRRKTFLEISITDTGVGIDPKNLDKIFRIDSKFTKPGTENEKGTGLGLILCKEFVEKQGGTIWATSQFGKGSIFTFTLPLKV